MLNKKVTPSFTYTSEAVKWSTAKICLCVFPTEHYQAQPLTFTERKAAVITASATEEEEATVSETGRFDEKTF